MTEDVYKVITIFEKDKPVNEVKIEIFDNDTLLISDKTKLIYKKECIVPIITVDYSGKNIGIIYGSEDTTYITNEVYKIDVHIDTRYDKVTEISVFLK